MNEEAKVAEMANLESFISDKNNGNFHSPLKRSKKIESLPSTSNNSHYMNNDSLQQ